MKSLALLSFLVLTSYVTPEAQAFHDRPAFKRSYNVNASTYCNEARFHSYMNLALSMRDYVTPYAYADLYLPLKIKASKALVTLKNYGPLSATTHSALYEIVSFVSANQNEFDALWEVEVFFTVAQDLMEMTQSLERDLK